MLDLAGTVPYGLGTRLLSGFFGNFLVQDLFFRNRRRQFDRFNATLGRAPNARIDFTRHLLTCFSLPWQVNTLSRCDETQLKRLVRIENAQVIDELKAAGRPILLVAYHTGIAKLGPLVLVRLGHDFSAIEPEPYLAMMGARGIERMRSILLRGQGAGFWMKELYQARQTLAANGIVQMALDGLQGTGGVERAFLGRRRVFHISMAKLALETGAAIVLNSATLDEKGRATLRFHGPVDTGEVTLPTETRLKMFLDQYVSLIENTWRTDPGNISVRHIQHYLKSEPMSETPEPSAALVPQNEGAV